MSSASASASESDGAYCTDSTRPSSNSGGASPTTPASRHKVQLAIYDLSQGMAKALSAQILGPAHTIDIVPHTGIVVFGKEYFFASGTGVAVESPDSFRATRNIQPMQVLDLGATDVSPEEFDQWCRLVSSNKETAPFHATKYNLFDSNCNHFSKHALRDGLRLGGDEGELVPQWIMDVPQKFLASPFGALARPVLENMQVSGGVPFTTTENNAAEDEDTTKQEGLDKDEREDKHNKKRSLKQEQDSANTASSEANGSSHTSQEQPTPKVPKLSHSIGRESN